MGKSYAKLDRLAIRKLMPGQRVMENGIEFQRLPNGDGLYSVNIMVDGQRIHRTIGRESEGVTRTQAEEFIAQVRTDARHDRLALPKGRKVALAFEDAAGKYIERLRASEGKNIDAKEQHLQQHLVPFFKGKPLSKVVGFDIERYRKQRLAQVVQAGGDWRSGKRTARSTGRMTSASTVNRELSTLSHLFNKAMEWEWISTRPKTQRLAEGSGRIVYLTAEQVHRFLDACAKSNNSQLYAFSLVALETSMRKTEILSIRREHIDLGRRMIYLPKAKAGAREQPITERLATFLEKYLRESVPVTSPWLFPSSLSKSGHTVALEKPFRAAAVEAGLNPAQVVRHTLRHTAVSHLVQSGVDLPTVKRISGHKSMQMVERYAHQDGPHIQAAMDKLQARLTKSA